MLLLSPSASLPVGPQSIPPAPSRHLLSVFEPSAPGRCSHPGQRAAGRDIAGYEPDAPKPYAATTRSLRSAPSRYSLLTFSRNRMTTTAYLRVSESPRTTRLYHRTKDEITLSEVERIRL